MNSKNYETSNENVQVEFYFTSSNAIFSGEYYLTFPVKVR